jgi:hypothetical protein
MAKKKSTKSLEEHDHDESAERQAEANDPQPSSPGKWEQPGISDEVGVPVKQPGWPGAA